VVDDARTAATCRAHDVDTFYTCDRDFRLFPRLWVEDPFA
jgi:predicted nucleic acid-binding protein